MRISRNGKVVSLLYTVALSFLVIVLSGCGLNAVQRKAVNEFGTATSNIGNLASEELVNMRNETIKMNVNRIILGGYDKEFPGSTNLDENLTPENSQIILQAIEVLQAYGEGLVSLVNATQKYELEKATGKLMKSIETLPKDYQKVSKEQQDAIAKVVQEGGKLIIEKLKKDTIEHIVPMYQPQVDDLADKLKITFDKTVTGSFANSFLTTYSNGLEVADRYLKNECTDISCRAMAMQNLRDVMANRTRTDTVMKKASESLNHLKKANAAMVEAVKEGGFKTLSEADIKEFSNSAKILYDAVKVLNK